MYAVSQSFWFTIEQWGTRSSDEQSRLPPLASNGWIMSLETPKGLTVRLKPDWSTASEASAPSLHFKKSTKSHPQHLTAPSMLFFSLRSSCEGKADGHPTWKRRRAPLRSQSQKQKPLPKSLFPSCFHLISLRLISLLLSFNHFHLI